MKNNLNTYQYNVYVKETYNATGKAKGDIITILNSLNINNLYNPSKYRIFRIVQQNLAIQKIKNNSNSILLIQYPAVIDNLLKRVSKKIRVIAIIHDLQSIRGTKSVKEEIALLNTFSVVISHNRFMTDYLKNSGLKIPIVNLELFDYLHNTRKAVQHTDFYKKRVCFAGNLNKSKFIKKLNLLRKTNFLLYGLLDNENTFKNSKNIEYKGSLPSDLIVNKLEGEFGLIWDGDSIETCTGKLGNYLKFNNPHKLSLYISAEKPVIVWKKSAVSEFVEKNKIGIVLNSLGELETALSNLSETNYLEFRKNIRFIKNKVGEGFYTKKAVTEALRRLEETKND